MRPFTSTEEMDEAMVERWNVAVKPHDHVYHLGDVCMKRSQLDIVRRLTGHKRLVRGNHDVFKTADYLAVGFEEIYGVRVWPEHGMIFSHIPLHPDCLINRKWKNVHGHLHSNKVQGEHAELYQSVCVEQINYTPVQVF